MVWREKVAIVGEPPHLVATVLYRILSWVSRSRAAWKITAITPFKDDVTS